MSYKVVFSHYPITKDIRSNLESKLKSDVEFIVISFIAHSGYANLLKQLRQKSCDELYIFTTSDDQQIMMPVLRFIGWLIPAKLKFVLDENGNATQWGGNELLQDVFRVFWSFLSGVFAVVAAVFYLMFAKLRGRVSVVLDEAITSQKILYLRPTLWQGLKEGGAISHSRGVIRGFLELGYFVECFADSKFLEMDEKSGNFQLINPRKAYILPRELNYFNFQWDFIRQTKKIVGASFQGVIYQRLAIGGFAGVVLSRLWRTPLVIEYNGSEIWLAKNWGSRFFLERIVSFVENLILSNAHLLVTVSTPLKSDLVKRGFDPDRIVVCPNGVDTKQFPKHVYSPNESVKAARAKLGFAEDDVVFTFVGTFGVWHGATVLANSILRIFEDVDKSEVTSVCKLRFLFIGNGVEYSKVRKKLHAELENGRVVMTGLVNQSEVISLLALSDVCVAPTIENQDGSEFFGSPTKLFEYMASAKPVIASDVGQIGEIMLGSPSIEEIDISSDFLISTDKTKSAIGISVAPGDIDKLMAAILAMARHKDAREVMGKNALQRAVSEHSWVSHVEKIVGAIFSLSCRMNNGRVRLLINALHSKSGGGVTYIRNMAPLLAARAELDVHIVIQKSQLALFDRNLDNVKAHIIDDQQGLWRLIFTEQLLIPRMAESLGADVIFSPANYGPLVSSKSVILVRNSLDVAFVDRRWRKIVYWALLSVATIASVIMAREVIAVSTYARNSSLRGVFSRLRKKVSIVPHGISRIYSDSSTNVSKEKFILTVSDIYVQKNLHTLVRAFALLLSTGKDIKLKVAGRPIDQEYSKRIIELVEELGISSHVEFLGHVETEKLKNLYSTCWVFAFPSTVETFGNPLAEAMASGCAIVSSNSAAMPEVAGNAAIYANPDSYKEFADALERFWDDENLRVEYAARARERSVRYSWKTTSQMTTEVVLRAAETK